MSKDLIVYDQVSIDEDDLNNIYEPSEEEIKEYAQYLGMNLSEDQNLLYIAREGLKAPLPKSWKGCKSEHGDIFYLNIDTNEIRWDHPLDEYYRQVYYKAKGLVTRRNSNNNDNNKKNIQGDELGNHNANEFVKYGLNEHNKYASNEFVKYNSKDVDKHGLKNVNKHDLKNLDRHSLKDVDKHSLKDLDKHGSKALDKYSLMAMDKHGSKDLDKHASNEHARHISNEHTRHVSNELAKHNLNELAKHGSNEYSRHGPNQLTKHGSNEVSKPNSDEFPKPNPDKLIKYKPDELMKYRLDEYIGYRSNELTKDRLDNNNDDDDEMEEEEEFDLHGSDEIFKSEYMNNGRSQIPYCYASYNNNNNTISNTIIFTPRISNLNDDERNFESLHNTNANNTNANTNANVTLNNTNNNSNNITNGNNTCNISNANNGNNINDSSMLSYSSITCTNNNQTYYGSANVSVINNNVNNNMNNNNNKNLNFRLNDSLIMCNDNMNSPILEIINNSNNHDINLIDKFNENMISSYTNTTKSISSSPPPQHHNWINDYNSTNTPNGIIITDTNRLNIGNSDGSIRQRKVNGNGFELGNDKGNGNENENGNDKDIYSSREDANDEINKDYLKNIDIEYDMKLKIANEEYIRKFSEFMKIHEDDYKQQKIYIHNQLKEYRAIKPSSVLSNSGPTTTLQYGSATTSRQSLRQHGPLSSSSSTTAIITKPSSTSKSTPMLLSSHDKDSINSIKDALKQNLINEYQVLLNDQVNHINQDEQILKEKLEYNEDLLLEKEIKTLNENIPMIHVKKVNDLKEKINELMEKKNHIGNEQEDLKYESNKDIKQEMKSSPQDKKIIKVLEEEYEKLRIEFDKEKEFLIENNNEMLRQYEKDEQKRQDLDLDIHRKDLKLNLERQRALIQLTIKQKEADQAFKIQEYKERQNQKFMSICKKLAQDRDKELKLEEDREYKVKDKDLDRLYLANLLPEHEKKLQALDNEKKSHELTLENTLKAHKTDFQSKYDMMKNTMSLEYTQRVTNLKYELNILIEEILKYDKLTEDICKLDNETMKIQNTLKDNMDKIMILNNEIKNMENIKYRHEEDIQKLYKVLNTYKDNLGVKNELIHRINDLHEMIDDIDKEIDKEKKKIAEIDKINQSKIINDTFTYQLCNTSIGVAKILKEVEDIKNKIKKKSEKKSLSTGRLDSKQSLNTLKPNNTILDNWFSKKILHGGGVSGAYGSAESDEEESLSKDYLDASFQTQKGGLNSSGPGGLGLLGGPNGYFPLCSRKFKVPIKPLHHQDFELHGIDHLSKPKSKTNLNADFEMIYEKWRKIIGDERQKLKGLFNILKGNKLKVKELHDVIKKEQNDYKVSCTKLKETPIRIGNNTQNMTFKLESIKKDLNDKIKLYNNELFSLKEHEKLLKDKDICLQSIETYLANAFENKQIVEGELETLYAKYIKGINLLNTTSTENQTTPHEHDPITRETSRFQHNHTHIHTPKDLNTNSITTNTNNTFTTSTVNNTKQFKSSIQKDTRHEYYVNDENDKSIANQSLSSFTLDNQPHHMYNHTNNHSLNLGSYSYSLNPSGHNHSFNLNHSLNPNLSINPDFQSSNPRCKSKTSIKSNLSQKILEIASSSEDPTSIGKYPRSNTVHHIVQHIPNTNKAETKKQTYRHF